MAVKIRLQRHGGKGRPFYYIVAAHSTSRRDGKFIEKLGTYNPLTQPATISLDRELALEWLNKGAQPTNTAKRILSFKGVLYLKHLMRGVSLGLFSEDEAKAKFETWSKEHDQIVAKRQEQHKAHKQEKRRAADEASVKIVQEKNNQKKLAAEAELAAAQTDEAAEDNSADAPATEEAPAE